MTVVVKLGSSLVCDGSGRVRRSLLAARAADIAAIAKGGESICIVSSGAIALGLPLLGLTRRPRATPQLQAASAAGQVRLQLAWEAALRRHGLKLMDASPDELLRELGERMKLDAVHVYTFGGLRKTAAWLASAEIFRSCAGSPRR